MAKNQLKTPTEYTRYYGDFRGVDFSSDHTNVHDQRFAYAINMYKDYRAGEGNAVETIPGYRRRFQAPRKVDANGKVTYEKINGIHYYESVNSNGERDTDIIVHAGKHLYVWDSYPKNVNTLNQLAAYVPVKEIDLSNKSIYKINSVKIDGKDPLKEEEFTFISDPLNKTATLILARGTKRPNSTVTIEYYTSENSTIATSETIFINTDLTIDLNFEFDRIESIDTIDYGRMNDFEVEGNILKLDGAWWWDFRGLPIVINYYESVIEEKDAMAITMADNESKSFAFDNKLFIADGTNYYVLHKSEDEIIVEAAKDIAYVPTTYRNLTLGEIAPEELSKFEYEQKNLLSDKYKHTYIANGGKIYPIYDNDFDPNEITATVYGKPKTVTFNTDTGELVFTDAPPTPEDEKKPSTYAGVEITFKKKNSETSIIEGCTVFATFDNRVFATGNPNYPNNIWYCGIGADGREDATYFRQLDYVVDGVENAPITGLIPVADTLAAVKNHARQDGSVYFHQRYETNEDVIPVTYPSQKGLSGIGCLGACVNFLDDPIFISRLGVEAIGQLSVRLERAIEHRSSLIDAKLVNLDLTKAKIVEWDGYLVILVDGKMFLADSRQRYQNDYGVMQYEWYYLENIGIYENQYSEYYYAPAKFNYITEDIIQVDGKEYPIDIASNIYNSELLISENLIHSAVKTDIYDYPNDKPTIISKMYFYDGIYNFAYFVIKRTWDGKTYETDGNPKIKTKAIVCDNFGSYTGGEFYPANVITSFDDNIFFGTNNGIVSSFNFDKRYNDGTIAPIYYSFDNRTIYCGIATKMDNCDVPHLAKSTIKKSTVIKTKSMVASAAKLKIRTNKKGYTSLSRLNSRVFSFEDVDFSDFSFVSTDQTIFAVKESEKNWVEKQHWIYSDEYCRPFSVNYIAFRYKISGRIKE